MDETSVEVRVDPSPHTYRVWGEVSIFHTYYTDSSVGKESACNTGDPSSIPGSGRSPGKENSYPLQYSGLENPMDCIVHGVAKSWTRLSTFHFHAKYGLP